MVEIVTPPDLLDKVILRIRQERLALIKRKLLFYAGLLLLTMVSIVPASAVFRLELAQSGMWQYLGMLGSDFRTVTHYLGDFSMSVLESLPAWSFTIFLALIFSMLHSLRAVWIYKLELNKLTHGHQ